MYSATEMKLMQGWFYVAGLTFQSGFMRGFAVK